ncbi:uncharacterized protein LOC132066094 [Lycium ferocissimum]|uniref:uncharacterized protein LOC132066094 n=1 Tax=Lycium ferocissimum TaxID=112874 RepID=UPI0028156D58|nr:uncharacterized protein LOC132066094 [Lycium ferocissimum]
MASTGVYNSLLYKSRASSLMGISSFPLMEPRIRPEITYSQRHLRVGTSPLLRNVSYNMGMKKVPLMITRASSKPSENSEGALGQNKASFVLAFSFLNYAHDAAVLIVTSSAHITSSFLFITPAMTKKLSNHLHLTMSSTLNCNLELE